LFGSVTKAIDGRRRAPSSAVGRKYFVSFEGAPCRMRPDPNRLGRRVSESMPEGTKDFEASHRPGPPHLHLVAYHANTSGASSKVALCYLRGGMSSWLSGPHHPIIPESLDPRTPFSTFWPDEFSHGRIGD
jgi:hypothetical protein